MHAIDISLGQALITGVTLGIVNPNADGIVLKDPVTGISDVLKTIIDFSRDFNKGVWTGTRGLNKGEIGLSSGVLRLLNADMVHQAVRINGISYSLTNEKQNEIQVEAISQQETQTYDWKYRGKSEVSDDEMRGIIRDVNNYSVRYHLLFANCQDISDSLSKYAMRLYDRSLCLHIIFPEIVSESDAFLYSIGVVLQGKTTIRLSSDIVAKLFK